MNKFLQSLKPNKTVLKRGSKDNSMPPVGLYVEWLASLNQRRILDADGKQHDIDDKTLESNFRLVTGGQAKKLIAEHWSDRIKKKEPVRKS